MNRLSKLLKGFIMFSAFATFSILFIIIGYILIKGIPYLKPSLFALEYTTENVSLFPAIITTLIMTFLALLISCPIGVFTGFYLIEYAKSSNKLVKIIRLTTETLSGIPSIVYGLFGLLFFVTTLGWSFSIAAGAFTLAIMILPLIIRATEEALLAVPNTLREASFGLGAGKLRTIFKIVLPTAMPGISSGIILAIGRIVGETAALIYTAGTVPQIPKNLFSSGRTLAIHMYSLSSEGLYTNEAYATAVVLLIVVIGINGLSSLISKKLSKGDLNG
ncbi:phosphate ABC transporter permease PstA [Tissierella praeacuta]|uniref:phosphate ABC transporter permease PstA n=1 Tax=Tissierella praeacuta TaxID=43131 RepID=UPI00333ED42C